MASPLGLSWMAVAAGPPSGPHTFRLRPSSAGSQCRSTRYKPPLPDTCPGVGSTGHSDSLTPLSSAPSSNRTRLKRCPDKPADLFFQEWRVMSLGRGGDPDDGVR